MTLTEFLLARYDEEDAQGGCGGPDSTCDQLSGKWLAQVEANRRIIRLHTEQDNALYGVDWDCTGNGYEGCATLRALALPYADHPDYREEWKP